MAERSGQPAVTQPATNEGIQQYYHTKIDELQVYRLTGGELYLELSPSPAGGGGEDTEREKT